VIVAICAERAVWRHVDAAYGGGALFSDRLAGPCLTRTPPPPTSTLLGLVVAAGDAEDGPP
jgi:hypothetical protein